MNDNNVAEFLSQVTFNKDGLVIAIAQDYSTSQILMLAYMNETTLRQTLETKHYDVLESFA